MKRSVDRERVRQAFDLLGVDASGKDVISVLVEPNRVIVRRVVLPLRRPGTIVRLLGREIATTTETIVIEGS